MLDARFLAKLESIETRFGELEARLADPALLADQNEFKKVAREHRRLDAVVEKYREYLRVTRGIGDTEAMLGEKIDDDFRELCKIELSDLKNRELAIQQELKLLLLPTNPNDEKNVVLEIRAGTGGEEAGLFCADLLRMYTRYAERHGWKYEELDASPTELGGYKEVVVLIKAEGAYSRLKYESGVHRVQRVPETEAQGRIQTSTATVAVMPEAEEVDVQIKPDDLRIEAQRSSGAGGQHVNKTESAIRITHLPSGIVVYCQEERSQVQNREKAMRYLMAKLYDLYQSQADEAEASARRSMVGTGDRSERIRTYNFPENRLSDHRIKLTLYHLAAILDGDLDEVLDALAQHDQAEKLAAAEA